jgi:ligand-binding sensor domain-containing protein/two-component sensor histidine kinase
MRREHLSTARLICILVAALLSWPHAASAEQLPLRHYGVYEGLPHSTVRCILQDSRGYLWIGTADGLARFDGYTFTTYDTADGLGHSFINSIAEDHHGRVWIATNGGGVSCFIDWAPQAVSTGEAATAATRKFVTFKIADQRESNRVNALRFDLNDLLWCATDGGVFRASVAPGRVEGLEFEMIVPHSPAALAMGAFLDSRGRLWFGNGNMIVEAIGDRIITYGPGAEFGREIRCFVEDHQGRMLAANDSGLVEFVEPRDPTGAGSWKAAPIGLSDYGAPHCLQVDSEGALWIGADHGLIKYKNGKTVLYNTSNGLSDNFVVSLNQDRDKNLWIGTNAGGLCMLSAEPVVAFGRSDGLPDAQVAKLFEDRAGHVYASTNGGGLVEVTEARLSPIEWSQKPAFNAIAQRIVQDGKGDWWVGTNSGLFWLRGPSLRLARGNQVTEAEGGPITGVVGDIYEDHQGKLWFGSMDNQLFCIDRSGESGRPDIKRVPLQYRFPYRRFVSDLQGDLWIGAQALMSRVTDGQDGLPQDSFLLPAEGEPDVPPNAKQVWDMAKLKLPPAEGLPETSPRSLLLDSRGWLWIGLRYKGVSVTTAPSADTLSFVNYSAADGLASNTVWSMAEDDSGRIYLGTGRGLDRLDPLTGRVRHITAGEKLVGDAIIQCMKDSRGNIWVATNTAILRLDPRAEPDQGGPPPIYLTKIRVDGTALPIPDAGAIHGPSLTLGSSGNDLLIEYVGLDFHSDRELKYQYRLDGVDTDWNPPTEQRSVNYASLAPGSYKFLVRAINQQGIASPEPAIVEFRILPPIWRTWWFLLAMAGLLALAAYAIHRNRVKRLVELLAVRTRIASDLHDDIGSNLTKIAVLSEVAHQQLGPQSNVTESPLTAIGRISRESVASMGDIVWAIDPRRDTHQDLVRRMRQSAIDMLGAAGVEVRFVVSGDDQPRRVGADFRRQVFLIFKEAVHNAARHAVCSNVEIEVLMERSGLTLSIRDDGAGFDTGSVSEGQGLTSMRRRAESLGGSVEVRSGSEGTTVILTAPWGR